MTVLLAVWGWLWCLPLHLAALVLLPFYGPQSYELRGGKVEVRVARAIGNPGGQTFGQVTFYTREPDEALRKHEDTHTLQAQLLGPWWPILYVLGCLWGACFGSWHDANPLELWAYLRSGIR